MIGFENFSVSAWFDNGLTRHVSAPKVKRQRRVTSIFAAAAVSTAMTAFSPAVIAKPASLAIEQVAMTSVKASADSEVSAGYWPALMKEMKTWQVAAEPDIDYPD
jgi:hypothetical protein